MGSVTTLFFQTTVDSLGLSLVATLDLFYFPTKVLFLFDVRRRRGRSPFFFIELENRNFSESLYGGDG